MCFIILNETSCLYASYISDQARNGTEVNLPDQRTLRRTTKRYDISVIWQREPLILSLQIHWHQSSRLYYV